VGGGARGAFRSRAGATLRHICLGIDPTGLEGRRRPRRESDRGIADVSVAGMPRRPGLCGPAGVAMREPADHGRLDDPALVEALYRSGFRGVLVQGEVGSGTVVVPSV